MKNIKTSHYMHLFHLLYKNFTLNNCKTCETVTNKRFKKKNIKLFKLEEFQ